MQIAFYIHGLHICKCVFSFHIFKRRTKPILKHYIFWYKMSSCGFVVFFSETKFGDLPEPHYYISQRVILLTVPRGFLFCSSLLCVGGFICDVCLPLFLPNLSFIWYFMSWWVWHFSGIFTYVLIHLVAVPPFFKGRQFLWLPDCFPAHHALPKKYSALKEQKLPPCKFLPFRKDPFSERNQNRPWKCIHLP